MKNSPLFFDYQSSTPCLQEVVEAMEPYWEEFWGNASSRQNRLGIYSSAAVALAREQLSSYLKVKPSRLIFTSGATESNNLALLGHARYNLSTTGSPGHLITMTTEHHSVLDPMRQLKEEGFRLTELRPNPDGLISIERFKESIEEDTFLVSIMLANNEIGVLQPINEISYLCREYGITFHCDAVQAFGYLPLELDQTHIDLVSISAHKIYGPNGVGALVVNEDVSILPLQWGGGQENGLRAGTLPVPLIVGFAKAAEMAIQGLQERNEKLQNLRNQLRDGLNAEIPNLIINGSIHKRLPHNLNVSIVGVNGNRLHQELRPFIACSSGSACNNGEPSHVLLEIGRNLQEAQASLRLSLGRDTSLDDIKAAIRFISQVTGKLST